MRIAGLWRSIWRRKNILLETPTDFAGVLQWEVAAINRARPQALACKNPASAQQANLVGLALSGGGIRSATFNLGVLQALAELKLLRLFDYLSTVSGGGYIGSWLTALIHRQGAGKLDPELEASLAAESRAGAAEHPAIKFLRDYSNYLTPRLGLFSADTLTMVTTALRNIYLNLAILIAFFCALLLAPRLLVRFDDFIAAEIAAQRLTVDVAAWLSLAAGAVLVLISLITIGSNLQYRQTPAHPWWSRETGIVCAAVFPTFVAAHFFSFGLSFAYAWTQQPLWLWLVFGMVLYTSPWVLGWLWSRRRPLPSALATPAEEPVLPHAPIWNLAAIVIAGLFGGWLLYGFTHMIPWLFQTIGGVAVTEHLFYPPSRSFLASWIVVGLGTPIIIKLFSLVVVLHIGLAGRYMTETSREWLSRLGAWLLTFALVWMSAFALLAFALPAIDAANSRLLEAGGIVGWLLSTVAGAYLGRSANSGTPEAPTWRDYIAIATPYIFVLGLFIMLTWGVHELLLKITGPNDACGMSADGLLAAAALQACLMHEIPTLTLVSGILICLAVGGALSLRVDVNLFSLHHFYRNRLTRCYLGASMYPERPTQPFTGFGSADDLHLNDLIKPSDYAEAAPVQRPYPIINAALNMVHGVDLGWQQRKAASFVFTPRYSGYELPAQSPAGTGMPHGCYRFSGQYMEANQGVTLGSAMTVSGAAASPNMGYHTSAPLAFLMTIFNVRLGRWCGNPCKDKWRNSGPVWGLPYLLSEVFSRATKDSKFVYLSDGGHFENLGIYELVRRRCRFIVAVDAGCDEKPSFEDLGNAIRKCYADFGVEIKIDVNLIRGENKENARYCAVGNINYGPDEAPGTLLYIKPSLIGDEPTDVLSYAAADMRFPHQPTADQWFDESQFESYRKLGHHIAKATFARACEPDPGAHGEAIIHPEKLFAALRELWNSPHTAPDITSNLT